MYNLFQIISMLLILAINWINLCDAQGIDLIEPPMALHNVSSFSCVVQFCLKYFHSEKAVIGSLVIVNLQNGTEFHSDLIIMLNEKTDYEMSVMTKDGTKKHASPAHVVDKAKNYFVVLNRTEEVFDAIRQWHRLPTWNPLAQVVAFFMNTYDDEELQEHLFVVFRAFLEVNMLNVNIIAYRNNVNIMQAFTYYPYQGSNCANRVEYLWMFDECEYSDDDDIPDIRNVHKLKMKVPNKLHNCQLNISAGISEPYVFYEEEEHNFYKGTEVLMVRTIAQALQMTPVFMLINETRENRVISNVTGIYASLFQKKADILIGGMENDPKIQKILWNSIPYRQDDETWCVATARPRDLWRNIFGIYTIQTWIALIGVIFFTGFLVYGLIHIEYKPENYIWSLMVSLASSLGQYANYEPDRSSVRIMMLFLFLYGLVMSASFNSFLISILTRPRFKPQVSSLRMAIEQEFDFAGGNVALSHYIDESDVSLYVRDHFQICPNNIDDCLKLLHINEKLAVAVSRLHAENSAVISRDQLFCFTRENNIYSYSIAIPTRVDFHLLPSFNYIIRQLFEFGLVERWDKLSQAIASSALAIKLAQSVSDGGGHLVVLTVGHIMGAVFVMLFGHSIAFIAFCSELLVNWQVRKQSPTWFWLKLNKFFVPKPIRSKKLTLFKYIPFNAIKAFARMQRVKANINER